MTYIGCNLALACTLISFHRNPESRIDCRSSPKSNSNGFLYGHIHSVRKVPSTTLSLSLSLSLSYSFSVSLSLSSSLSLSPSLFFSLSSLSLSLSLSPFPTPTRFLHLSRNGVFSYEWSLLNSIKTYNWTIFVYIVYFFMNILFLYEWSISL